MDSQQLEAIDEEKDLGVYIDKELKFHVHTAYATKNSNRIVGSIKRSYETRHPNSICMLYKSIVRPHLEYGNAIWGPHYKGDIKEVEAIQHRITKMIPSIKDMTYEDRLKFLKLPSLVYRRKRGDMILMYKIMNGLVRIDPNELFTPARTYHTRDTINEFTKTPRRRG